MPTPDAPRAVVAAALVDDLDRPTRLLAARRTEPPQLAGGWEFPGGKVEPGETETEALHRELREELGVIVETGPTVDSADEDGRWPLGDRYRMRVWLAVVTQGDARPLQDHDELRWLTADTVGDVAWLPADRPIVAAVTALMDRTTVNP